MAVSGSLGGKNRSVRILPITPEMKSHTIAGTFLVNGPVSSKTRMYFSTSHALRSGLRLGARVTR